MPMELCKQSWFKIDGEDYYAVSSGAIIAQWVGSGNNWYYVDANGKMVTGDYKINEVVNRFDANGVWLGKFNSLQFSRKQLRNIYYIIFELLYL